MLPVSISLTLALLGSTNGGRPTASPGSATPRGVLDRLLDLTDRRRPRPVNALPSITSEGALPLTT